MATKMRSLRVADELWEWAAGEAARRGMSRTGLIEALLSRARDGEPAAAAVRPVSGRPGVRVDTPDDARAWAAARQRKLNEAKFR